MEGGLSAVEDATELLVATLSAGGSVADAPPGVSVEVLSRRICASVGVASAGCVSARSEVAVAVAVVVVVTLGSAASLGVGA